MVNVPVFCSQVWDLFLLPWFLLNVCHRQHRYSRVLKSAYLGSRDFQFLPHLCARPLETYLLSFLCLLQHGTVECVGNNTYLPVPWPDSACWAFLECYILLYLLSAEFSTLTVITDSFWVPMCCNWVQLFKKKIIKVCYFNMSLYNHTNFVEVNIYWGFWQNVFGYASHV